MNSKMAPPGTTPPVSVVDAPSGAVTHTPGPWVWALDAHDQCTSLRRSGSGDSVVHPQADISNYGLSVDCWNDLSKEDADLIAAAPDLLGELRRLLWQVATMAESPDVPGAWRVQCGLKADLARAAIAKATGAA